MGERTPVAVRTPRHRGVWRWARPHEHRRCDVRKLTDVRLSANWMAACGEPGEDARPVCHRARRGCGTVHLARKSPKFPVGKDRYP